MHTHHTQTCFSNASQTKCKQHNKNKNIHKICWHQLIKIQEQSEQFTNLRGWRSETKKLTAETEILVLEEMRFSDPVTKPKRSKWNYRNEKLKRVLLLWVGFSSTALAHLVSWYNYKTLRLTQIYDILLSCKSSWFTSC